MAWKQVSDGVWEWQREEVKNMTFTTIRVRVRATFEEDTELEIDMYDIIRDELLNLGTSDGVLPFDVNQATDWDFDIQGQI